ncbi:MAG: DNA alkylation repair protein, partial [Anaerolineales bacterium]
MTTTAEAVLQQLKTKASPENIKGMGKFGMATDERLGVPVPEMRKIAKGIGKDHELALRLWKTGVQEARIVASMIDVPEEVTED